MNLRIVRKKIKSVKNVKKITKAMQLMSAVKMKKAVALELESRAYRDGISDMIKTTSISIDPNLSPLIGGFDGASQKDLVIFISANKGLCGAFHVNLLKYVQKNLDLSKTEFVTIGSKGVSYLTRIDRDLVADFSSNEALSQVSAIFDLVINSYKTKKYRSIKILFSKYISITKSEIVIQTILPLPKIENQKFTSSKPEIIIEPNPQSLIRSLINAFIEEQIRGAIISSQAVEHSSRMLAMKNATDSAQDVIYSLTLIGNRIRQSKITSELLDMVTAKESVETG